MPATDTVHARLAELGIILPQVAPPAANYIPWVISGHQIFISGQLPFLNGVKAHIGRLGDTIGVEDGKKAAYDCALNIVAQVNAALDGRLGQVTRCVRLGGFVNATADFTDHPAVVNGASDLIASIFGDAGRHTRFAVGVASLPFGVAVEIDAVFEYA